VLLPEGTASFVYNPRGGETAPALTLPMQARGWIMRPPYVGRRGPVPGVTSWLVAVHAGNASRPWWSKPVADGAALAGSDPINL
jgi:hypothetical protein